MKKVGKTVGAALLFICATVGVYFPHASAATNVHSVDCTFDPVSMPKGAGPVMLELAFTPKHRCDEVTVKVTKLLNLGYTSDTAWVVQVEKEKWYRKTLNVSIAPNDTSGIELTLQCGRVPNEVACYFVTTGDTLEFYRGNPRGWHPLPPPRKTADPIWDTLTQEQLQTEYEVLLDLHDSTHLKTAEKIIGPLPDSSIYDHRRGYYRLWITLEKLLKITDEGIDGDFVTPPPWHRKSSPPKDSVPQPLPPHSPEADEINVDTLTPEQLLREYEVVLWFRDSAEQKFVESLVGVLPESATISARLRLYRLRISLEKLLKIRERNIETHFETSPPRQKRYRAPKDTVPQPPLKDSAKPQGALDSRLNPNSPDGFSLEYVDGSGAINMVDVTYLVDRLFFGGAPTAPCP